jgi:hypothetical protein
MGLWNLLSHFLSSEAFLFAHDGFGYESVIANWNAAEALPWFLADFATTYHTLAGGMEQLVEALQERLKAASNVVLSTGCTVTSITPSRPSISPLAVTYNKLEDDGSHSERRCHATNVILALPQNALRALRLDESFARTPREAERFKEDVETVSGRDLFKLFLGYENAWWEQEATPGEPLPYVTTDLPVRQVYYAGPGSLWRRGKLPPLARFAKAGMVLAAYSDAHYLDFWEWLETPTQRQRDITPERVRQTRYFRGDWDHLNKEEHHLLDKHGIPPRMAYKVHAQLLRLHAREGMTVKPPHVGVFNHWHGGWHTWNPGVKPWEVSLRLVRPFPWVPLYLCGEAYSRDQGWMEGALKSAELVLSSLGVTPPALALDGREWHSVEEYIYSGEPKPLEHPSAELFRNRAMNLQGSRNLRSPSKGGDFLNVLRYLVRVCMFLARLLKL